MRKGYVVWDWNGTLFDDVAVSLNTMNDMLMRRKLPIIPGVEEYRKIFTFPVSEYYKSAGLDFSKEPFEKLAEEYIADYNWRARECSLALGAEQVIRRLNRLGLKQIIASASNRETLLSQVEKFGIEGSFQAILGIGDSLAGGKTGLAREYFRRQDVSAREALFVGDTVHDFEVAREMGCQCVLIAGGHHSREMLETTGAVVLEDISGLPDFLNGENK